MSDILVSVITVVYNGEKYLQQTINSVKNQSYKEIEYIVIDGESTDGTKELIKSNESFISKWISEPDKGLYDAMNKGVKLANGKLIGIINSDDWYEVDAVEKIVLAYKSSEGKKIFHGDRYNILKDGSKELFRFNPSRFKLYYFSMTFNHPSMFFHKDIYQTHTYNESLTVFSDYEFVLRLYLKTPNNFIYIPEAYVNYRLDGLSSKIPFIKNTKEGFKARKNAGFRMHQLIFYLLVRCCFHILKPLISLFKKYK